MFGRKLLVVLGLILSGLLVIPALASADREFTPRFSANVPGDVIMASNTLMTCAPSATDCALVQAGGPRPGNATLNNNGFAGQQVDVDSDPTTSNSSRAQLDVPSGATVLFAGLYWSADGQGVSPQSARQDVKIQAPGDATYRALNPASTVLDTGNIGGHQAYQGFQDVTSIVRAAGGGTYTVGGVAARTGAADLWAGWSLVVVLQDSSQPVRNLTVFDGLKSIGSTSPPSTIQISGFTTPPAGQVKTRVGMVAYEGDLTTSGDSASLNGQRLSDAVTPSTNFFNSSISRDGVRATSGDPSYSNQLGYDAKIVQADGILANGASTASIALTTNGDAYLPGVVTFATDLYAPQLAPTKTVQNLTRPGQDARHGDTVRYTVSYENAGQDGADGLVIRDPLPVGVTYAPGTLKQTAGPGGPGASGPTDASGDDVGEYDGPGRQLILRTGTGASSTTGGRLAPSETISFTFDATVDADATDGQRIDNVAHASFTSQTLHTVFSDITSPVATLVVAAPDPTITKTHAGAIVAGAPVTFSIGVSNAGSVPTIGPLTVTDVVDGTIFTGVQDPSDGTWSCTLTPGPVAGDTTVSCTTPGPIAGGGTLPPIQLTATAADPLPASVLNTATVSGGDDVNPSNNTATDVGTGTSLADLQVTKTSSPGRGVTGDAVTWTVEVTNAGPSTAANATMDDPTVSGVDVTSATTDRGTCTTTPAVSCDLGTMAAGATATITIEGRITGNAVTITNTATVATPTPESTLANNAADAEFVVDNSADLEITKVVDLLGQPSPITAGDDLDYVLTVRNAGPGAADLASVRDLLPTGYTWISTTVTGAAFDCGTGPVGGAVICTIPQLASGDTATIRIHGTATREGRYDNTAAVAAETPDPDTSNNQGSTTTIVTPAADLQLYKQFASSEPVAPGDTTTFSLRLVNAGPSIGTSVTISDPLPAGMSFVSSDNPACSGSATAVDCNVGSLPVGDPNAFTATITVRIDADAAPGSILANRATATGDPTDPYPDNSSEDKVMVGTKPPVVPPVIPPVDPPVVEPLVVLPLVPGPGPPIVAPPVVPSRPGTIELRKIASRSTVRSGQRVDFRLRVRARGGDIAKLAVCDRLPKGLVFASRRGLRISGRTGCATISRLRAGQTRTVTIRTFAERVTGTRRVRNVARATAAGQRAVTAAATVAVRPAATRGGGVTG